MEITKLHQLYLQSSGITTDTRKIAAGNIFFALKGANFNANTFAEKAIELGARLVVVDEIASPSLIDNYGSRVVLVENVLTTLQELAAYHRSKFEFPVLAITGSNGKTTTKELVAAVLSKKFSVGVTQGNLNNHIGIPLTLLSIQPSVHNIAVIEMGANHQGEINSYCQYVQPDFGLITNVGLAHIEGFGGVEGVIKGKTELYRHISPRGGKIFIQCNNQTLLSKAAEARLKAQHTITYGECEEAFCTGSVTGNTEFLQVLYNNKTIHTNLVGRYNFENVMSAICIGKYFGIDDDNIVQAIEAYVPSNNRSQKIAWNTNHVILDAYNANPSSMSEALKNFGHLLQQQSATGVTILGEMMELGEYSAEEHSKIFNLVQSLPLSTKIFVGDGFAFVKNITEVLWFANVKEVQEWINANPFSNKTILVKGSRKNQLEKIFEAS